MPRGVAEPGRQKPHGICRPVQGDPAASICAVTRRSSSRVQGPKSAEGVAAVLRRGIQSSAEGRRRTRRSASRIQGPKSAEGVTTNDFTAEPHQDSPASQKISFPEPP